MTSPKNQARLLRVLVALVGLLILVSIVARVRRTTDVRDAGSGAPLAPKYASGESVQLDSSVGDGESDTDSRHAATDQTPVIKKRPGTILFGIVVDQDDVPVGLADLWLTKPRQERGGVEDGIYLDYDDKARLVALLHTDPAGSFRSEPIDPGEYWLGLPPPKLSMNKRQPEDISSLAQSVHVPGDADEQEVRLHVSRGIYIRGQVLAPGGGGVASQVRIDTLPNRVNIGAVNTDDDGMFVAGPLTSGRYRLLAYDTGVYLDSDAFDAVAGEAGVILHLRQGGVIDGVIVDQETKQLMTAHTTARRREFSDISRIDVNKAGHFHEDGVAPGLYDLRAESEDGRVGVFHGLHVESSNTIRPVTIELSPGATLVLDSGGTRYMDDCDLYSDEAWIGSASLPEWDSVRVIVPAGTIQIRFHVEDQARTVDVVAAVGRECYVTLKK